MAAVIRRKSIRDQLLMADYMLSQSLKLLLLVSAITACVPRRVMADELTEGYPGAKTLVFIEFKDRSQPLQAVRAMSTEAPFAKVVRYYVERSGQKNPNWKFLGAKFPGEPGNATGQYTGSGLRNGVPNYVSILHHVDDKLGHASIVFTDSDDRVIAVMISANPTGDGCHIQLHRTRKLFQ